MSGHNSPNGCLSFSGSAKQPGDSPPPLSERDVRDICSMVESRLYDAAFPLHCLASLVEPDENLRLAYLLDTLFKGEMQANADFMQRLKERLRHAE